MPNLYDGYCYETMSELSDVVVSRPLSTASAYWAFLTKNSISGSTVTYTTWYRPTNSSSLQMNMGNLIITYPTCTSVGPQYTGSGVTIADASLVCWMVVLVWASAYYFKQLRVGVRGY